MQIRDYLIFIAGLLGFLHEVFISHIDRPELLVASLAMMGLPLFLPTPSRDQKPPDPGKE